MEQLGALVKAGYGSELIIFELGSRVFPNLIQTLPAAHRLAVQQYVREHVLVRIEDGEEDGENVEPRVLGTDGHAAARRGR